MGEIQLTRIKSIYGDLKGFLDQIPSEAKGVDLFLVSQFNQTIEDLTSVSGTDFSKYNIPMDLMFKNWRDMFPTIPVRAQLGRVISRLESEYGFDTGENQPISAPGIVILNKNHNEVSLQINYTLADLIKNIKNDEGKEKLNDLQAELNKPVKDWGIIKPILIWILNFSKDLFLQILPILLEKKI